MRPPLVVADAGYGQNADFRAGLTGRGIAYVVAVRSDTTAHPAGAVPHTPPWSGNGRKPQPRYRHPPAGVAALACSAGQGAFTQVTWRQGSRGALRSRFLALRVRPAGVKVRRLVQNAAVARAGSWDGVLPELWLLAEWPADAKEPTNYWLSTLPADTPITELVRLAKIRWRIEHDYRELKHGLGLDHFEGRSWTGWHHHVTLATAAHAFLTEQRLSPKADTPDSPSTRSSTPSRTC
jgi:SRSO17 transposase